MPDSPAVTLLEDLRAALEIEGESGDKIEKRFPLMRPFEKRLAVLAEPPAAPPDDRVGKIADLLWHKTHPDRADIDVMLSALGDDDGMVRATAASAIAVRLDHLSSAGLDPHALYRARVALEGQRVRERLPWLAFQLQQLIAKAKAADSPRTSSPASDKPTNPYVAGPPLRDRRKFFGRDDVLSAIKQALAPDSGFRSLVIYGSRRSGKTSLLYRIREGELGEGMVPAYFDMQQVAGTTLANFLGALVSMIDRATSDTPLPGSENIASFEAADFPALHRAVRDALARIGPRSLIVCFDEYEVFQEFLGDAVVARQLQSLLEQERSLFFVFAGAQKVEALKEDNFAILLDNCRYMKISYLLPADARRLITEPTAGILEFPNEVVDQIQLLSAGHPFYTQALGQTLFDLLQAANRRTVTLDDVERAVRQFVENPAPHLLLGWNALDLDRKIAASALSTVQKTAEQWVTVAELRGYLKAQRYPVHVGHAEMQQALAGLRDQDWTVKREGEREFKLTMDLVRRWIAEHRSIWELLEEQQHALIAQAAGSGKRAAALAIDLVTLGVIGGAITETLGFWAAFAAVAAYFVLFLAWLQATPGMLLMHIRTVRETGAPLRGVAAVPLGLMLALPWLLIALAFGQASDSWIGAALGVSGLGVVVLHWAMVRIGKRERGLFDKLGGAVFVAKQEPNR